MQVLCMATSNEQADIACPTCGQKYAVYFSRKSTAECEAALTAVRSTLVEHHEKDAGPSAHASLIFNVPAWNGPAHMSAAALLSGAPIRNAWTDNRVERLAS